MTQDTRKPNMGKSHVMNCLQRSVIKRRELTTTIFGNRAGLHKSLITIAEKSG